MAVIKDAAGSTQTELAAALATCRSAFIGVGLISGIVNVLTLTGAFFMLQVYDRVLASRSVPTLVGLALLAVGLYIFQGTLDAIRGRILVRIGGSVDESLSGRIYDLVIQLPLKIRSNGDGLEVLRDFDQIRAFLTGPGPTAFFDLPWMPLYLAICFIFHPLIGIVATIGTLMLITLTVITEISTRKPTKSASQAAIRRNRIAESSNRNAEVIKAMGLAIPTGARWNAANTDYVDAQRRTSDVTGGLGAASKMLRMILQSGILGVGAWLVIQQQVTAGIMIASSIMMSRALAPVELAIAHWKGFAAARQSWTRLNDLFAMLPQAQSPMDLPDPVDSLSVEAVSIVPPGEIKPAVQSVSFKLNAGQGCGIIGPSASGKSSLARAIVGVWPPARGTVRLDGAALEHWSPERLGPHIGYLPQDVELFGGTIADNIGRLENPVDSNAVIAAAKAADVHEMILQMPDGYETEIGEGGLALSAGQRQRIALARALFRDPFLVVLDEPNSNLDAEGESALTKAIGSVCERNGIVIVIAHRPSALAGVDQVLMMRSGKMLAFGPKNEVLGEVLQKNTGNVVGALKLVPAGTESK